MFVSPTDFLWALAAFAVAGAFAFWTAWAPGRARPGATAAVWTAAALYFLIFAAWSLGKHYAMATCGLDLGYYANVIYHFGKGNLFRQTVDPATACYSQPCAPLLAALAPFTYVLRDPAYLLVIQSALLAAGVPMIYYLAGPAEGTRWPAAALALAFALSPFLHGANLYDFHPRAFAVPLTLAAFYFFSRGHFARGVVFTALLALAREELAAHAVILALWGGFATGKKKAGLVAAAALALYAFGFCLYLYPKLTYAKGVGRPYFYHSFVLAPPAAEGEPLTPAHWREKFYYLAALIVPLAPLVGGGGTALATLATPAAVPLLTRTETVFQLGWQYPLSILPFVFGTAALGLRRLLGSGKRMARAAGYAGAFGALAAQFMLVNSYGGRYYRKSLAAALPGDHEKALAGVVHRVPPGVPVCADDNLHPHLAQRDYAYLYYLITDKEVPVPPRYWVLDRHAHGQTEMGRVFERAEEWGLKVIAADKDHALFADEGKAVLQIKMFKTWFGSIEEWRCEVPGGGTVVRDPLAHDGRAVLATGTLRCGRGLGYVYPPGDYKFVFRLRAATPKKVKPVFITLKITSPHGEQTTIFKYSKVIPTEKYARIPVRWYAAEGFQLAFEIAAPAPFYFDAVWIESEDFLRFAAQNICRDTPPHRTAPNAPAER